MRLSISCDACRRAKVKCMHGGTPPCQRCQRTKTDSCVLTDPRDGRSRESGSTGSKGASRKRKVIEQSPTTPVAESRSQRAKSCTVKDDKIDPISSLSISFVISAIEVYRKKFPIANFLHYPSLIADVSANFDSIDPVFIASLLSLCVRFLASEDVDDEETYANYARTHLARRVMEAPSLYLAQSLVMISFYEWGTGRPYQAWMYSGMATYMIQSLLKMADDSMEHSPHEFHASQTQYEQLVRTYWCNFAQDCELSSGARQHFALSFSQISVPLPISDRDFTFNQLPERRLMPVDMNKKCPLANNLTIENGLTIVIRGFDIFVRILRFANEHRRSLAYFTSDESPDSPLRQDWHGLKAELDEWRSLQDRTVKYPETSAHAHVSLGYGELFAYINLLYFMSIVFLHRDRFLSNLKPHSAVFQDMVGDDQYQPETIEQLFEAAQHIGGILSALEACEASVMTPYSGFSIFVTAHINMYGTLIPQHYPGGLDRAAAEKNHNMMYLERLSKMWPVGRSWKRTVQDANRFYETVRSTQTHPEAGMHSPRRFALAGTLDEYGDIRSRPSREHYATRSMSAIARQSPNIHHTSRDSVPTPSHHSDSFFPKDPLSAGSHPDLETDIFQWPFIDASWSVGFDAGLDGLWHHSGLFDQNTAMR
ncbi:hypothetical protein PDE_08441 [Penicillium oxalicum 114-2]|uniref:Zn(2)-C6 fungal-type domain-containing protein n=1 Tax=Penicillium oxalicum (strain 114-2 / CGMCC 5302) TaxID=933388 RepID=S7ZST0_PENO1|nr:hypothetical protein PDE_08441 [Penicillium oxalicum 114-2]